MVDNKLNKQQYEYIYEAKEKIEKLKKVIAGLREEVKSLKKESEELTSTLKRSRGINRGLLLIMYERGIADEGRSLFSFFKEVKVQVKNRKTTYQSSRIFLEQ